MRPDFKKRIDKFLAIAARHHIRPLFVLFDSCWDPVPQLGPQHAPMPGVHNSGWVQSPGAIALADPAQYPRLKAYVIGVVGGFANDSRILGWDVWNEPGSDQTGNYPKTELKSEGQDRDGCGTPAAGFSMGPRGRTHTAPHERSLGSRHHLERRQARRASGNPAARIRHHYLPQLQLAGRFQARSGVARKYNRPVICTEYMARSVGSTFDAILPIAKQEHVGSHQLGIRRRQDADLFPLGILAASLREGAAAGVVPRSVALGRDSLPAGRSGSDTAAYRKVIAWI